MAERTFVVLSDPAGSAQPAQSGAATERTFTVVDQTVDDALAELNRNRVRQIAGQGLGMSTGDELEALVRTGGGLWGNYGETLDEIRGELRDYQTSRPGEAFGGAVLGGAIIPGFAAGQVLRGPMTLHNVGRAGAVTGAGFGAVAGFGAGEGLSDRIGTGAVGAGMGAALGYGLSAGAHAAQNAFRSGVRVARDPTRAAQEQVLRAAADDGVDLGAIRNTIAPTRRGARALTRDQVDTLLDAFSNGETAAQAAGRAGVTAATARSYYGTFQANTRVPRNLIDYATEQSPARTMKGLARGAASVPGPGQNYAHQQFLNRQLGQQQRIVSAVDGATGANRMTTEMRDALARGDMRAIAGQQYAALASHPPIIVNARTPAGQTLASLRNEPEFVAIEQFARRMLNREGRSVPDPNVYSFDLINEMQKILREAAEVLPTADTNSRMTARLYGQMRNELLDATERHFPGFAETRAAYRQGMAQLEALEAGRTAGVSNARPAREIMANAGAYGPAEQQAFRVGMGDAIADTVNVRNPYHDASLPLSGTVASNRIRDVLGGRVADQIGQEAAVARNTRDIIQGSRTAVLGEEIAELTEPARAAASMFSGNPMAMANAVGERIMRAVRSGNAEQLARLLTTTDQRTMIRILDEVLARAPHVTARDRRTAQIAIGLATGMHTQGSRLAAGEGR